MRIIQSAIRPVAPLRLNKYSPQYRGLTTCLARFEVGYSATGIVTDLASKDIGSDFRQFGAPNAIVSTPTHGMVAKWEAGNLLQFSFSSSEAEFQYPATWLSWLYPTTFLTDENDQTWFSTGDGAVFYGWYASVGGGTLNLYTNTAGTFFKGTQPVLLNEWNLVAFGVDANSRRLSVNGRPWEISFTSGVPHALCNDAIYGRRSDGLTANPSFIGMLGELRRYGSVLTDAEIARIYDPITRWELYNPPRRIFFNKVVASVPGEVVSRNTIVSKQTVIRASFY